MAKEKYLPEWLKKVIVISRLALTNSRLSNIIIRRKNNGTHEEPAENG